MRKRLAHRTLRFTGAPIVSHNSMLAQQKELVDISSHSVLVAVAEHRPERVRATRSSPVEGRRWRIGCLRSPRSSPSGGCRFAARAYQYQQSRRKPGSLYTGADRSQSTSQLLIAIQACVSKLSCDRNSDNYRYTGRVSTPSYSISGWLADFIEYLEFVMCEPVTQPSEIEGKIPAVAQGEG